MNRAIEVAAAAVLLALGALAFGSGARAGQLPSGPIDFRIDSSLGSGADPLHLTPTLVANPDGTYSAVGGDATPTYSLLFDVTLNPDPAVSGSFTLHNLSNSTQTFSVSATLGVLPMAAPTRVGGSYGDTTYTDTGDDGDTNTPAGVSLASALFYQARIDGTGVASLGSFSFSFPGTGVFGTVSQETFGTPIPSQVGPAVIGSIGVAFPGFSLSAGDTVHVPFEFVVVPEPGFASLFALSGAVFLVASRRKFFHSDGADR